MLANRMKKLAKDWFLFGMISAVILATLFPDIGRSGGTMHADIASNVGIFLVFLFHGVGLSTESMKKGLSNWRLHLMVQSMTYVVFPLLWLVMNALIGRFVPEYLMLGFLYLCALPSTISSSVAMTAIGKGNVPGAIFNATLSSLLGIFLTPLIISLALETSGGEGLSLMDAMINIAVLLFLPFVLGQLLRPVIGRWFSRYKKYINNFDKGVILMLVYASFCDSVKGGLWTNYGLGTIALTMVGAAFILFIVLGISTFAARRFGFNKEDEVAAVFCGSKKTLASGVPMAKLLFGAHPGLGVIVLPIMFYHQIQLFTCSILAERYARRLHSESDAAPSAVAAPVQEPANA
jgi:solute carrier family 10 (sodium/bile acid cotransporter), member 7